MRSQKVIVAGAGISGIAAAKLLLAMGGEVVLYDSNDTLSEEELRAKFEDSKNITIVLGELRRTDLLGVELCIISPGIPLESPFVEVIDEVKIPVWGEVQLAYQCSKGRLAAITGTNGKTTTTALTGQIMKDYFKEVFVVGNIGIPYTEIAMETTDNSITVAEVSSFQLETIMDFKPQVSAILNITPDHLDRHGSMDRYIEIKKSIAINQGEEDTIVLNYEDPVLRSFGQKEKEKEKDAKEEEQKMSIELKAKVVFFSSKRELKEGIFLDGNTIVRSRNGRREEIVDVSNLQLLGRHNYENVMAASAIALSMGVPLSSIKKTVVKFKAVEHRIEFVAERSGVKYYNDSKGTNPDAAIQAIYAMPGPTILIAGGYDKHNTYDEWIEAFAGKVKYLVLLGQTRDKIAQCAREHGFTDIMYAEDMQEAVRVCASYANMGENVLLSPACASWGMFRNYEERGRIFKECVYNL